MIPVNEPLFSGNEKQYLDECIETGWVSSEGKFVTEFENKLANRVNRQHAIAVSNGSAALDIAIAALNIGPGDEVIVPTFTIISCVASIVRAGAKPVLVDCDEQTWNMDIEQLESAITNHTRAIMMVHIYGLPVDVDKVLTLADKHGLYVIEDAAEMLGQSYKNQPCGSFGDISTFSFYPNKLVTTGEGGMVLTNDAFLAERCRSLMNLCFQNNQRFVHEELGWNFRMSNLQAAVGLAQLENLDEAVSKKREIGSFYQELLANITRLKLPIHKTKYADNIYWVFGIVLDHSKTNLSAKQLMSQLAEKKIGTRPFFWPMHKQPVFNKQRMFINDTHPVAEYISTQGLYIPGGLAITRQQQEIVANVLIEMLA